MNQDPVKEKLANLALRHVKDKTLIGLGSGTTAQHFIVALAEHVKKNKLTIHCVSSSIASAELAKKEGLSVIDGVSQDPVDLLVDGADFVKFNSGTIKGYGAALVREKLLAYQSKKYLVLIDSKKVTEDLSQHALPLVVLPFGFPLVVNYIESLNLNWSLRLEGDQPLITDDGLTIIDLIPPYAISWNSLIDQLNLVPGIVDIGYFQMPAIILSADKDSDLKEEALFSKL